MDPGTLHVLCNLHHVVGGTIDLDSIVRNVLEDENSKDEPQRRLIRVRHPFDNSNTSTNIQGCPSNRDNMASIGFMGQSTASLHDGNSYQIKKNSDQIPQDSSSNAMDHDTCSSITANVSEGVQRAPVSIKGMTQSMTSDSIGQNVRQDRCQAAQYSLFNKIQKFDHSSGLNAQADVNISWNTSQGNGDTRVKNRAIPSTSGLQNAQVFSANVDNRRETHSGPANSDVSDQREDPMDTTKGDLKDQQCPQMGLTQQQDTSALEAIIDKLVRAQACFDEPLEGVLPAELQPSSLQGSQQTGQQSHEAKDSTVSMKRAIMQLVGQKIQQIIKFAKAIPEFLNLNMSDRLALIKASKSEGSTIGSSVVDEKNNTIKRVLAKWRAFNFSEQETCLPRAYMEKRVQIADDLEALNLSAREAAVLRAMVITYPGRCELEEEGRVKRIHANMVSCLYHVLHEERCPDVPQRLENIHRVLASLRSMTESHSNILEEVFQKWSELDDFEIVKEFLNL